MNRGIHRYNHHFNIDIPTGFPVDGTLMEFASSDTEFSFHGGWSLRKNDSFQIFSSLVSILTSFIHTHSWCCVAPLCHKRNMTMKKFLVQQAEPSSILPFTLCHSVGHLPLGELSCSGPRKTTALGYSS